MSDIKAGCMTQVDVLRHGQVATAGLFCAPSEEPLSEAGWQQLVTTTMHATPDVIISSPSRRCYEFAEHLAEKLDSQITVTAAFQEMNFGHWVGQTTAMIWEQDSALLQQLWQQPETFIAPGGEALTDFAARVHQGWQALLEQHSGQRILLLTHGGVIRVLLSRFLGVSYRNTQVFDPGYGTALRLRVYADGMVSVYGLGVSALS